MSTNNISSQEAIPDARSTTDHQQSNQTDQGSPDTLKTSSTDIQVCSDDGAPLLPTSSKFPESLLNKILAFCDQHGKPYIAAPGKKNPLALRIGSRQANLYLRGILYQAGIKLSSQDLRELNDDLQAHAELSGVVRDVYIRVAPYKDGVEIDRGDNDRTRIRVTSGKVEIIRDGSEIFFYRPTVMRELPMPADHGDLTLFDKFTNIHPVNRMLMYAFMSYTLAHPKVPTTNYPILTVTGEEGSSKSTLCKFTQQLIDPSIVGAQSFPKNQQDLVIAAEQSHLLIYDNIRIIKHSMADTLCIAASGGTVTNRKLYTDDDLHVYLLHASFILNGIHPFVDQPDLAQRCLPIHLQPIDQKNRQSEAELTSNFETDLPVIFRGLLNLVADVLTHLPSAEITNPERMFEFSRWLDAGPQTETRGCRNRRRPVP
jgi:hypothetical protein